MNKDFISIVSILLGVSISSLRRWDNEGLLLSTFRTPGGHRRYKYSEILEIRGESSPLSNQVFGYARVSGHKQKKDLQNQIKAIKNFARANNLQIKHIYSDIASGINDNRRNFIRLLKAIPIIRPKALIITYRDRLSRYGLFVIDLLCKLFACELRTIYQNDKKDPDVELVEGVIELVTSYAGRFHRKRRGMI